MFGPPSSKFICSMYFVTLGQSKAEIKGNAWTVAGSGVHTFVILVQGGTGNFYWPVGSSEVDGTTFSRTRSFSSSPD